MFIFGLQYSPGSLPEMCPMKTNKVMGVHTFDDCTELNKVYHELEAVAHNEDSDDDDENSGNNEVSSLSLTQAIQSGTSCPKKTYCLSRHFSITDKFLQNLFSLIYT